jgi:hypothetical protein
MMVERALFESVGWFDESLRRLEDWEWLLRCAQTTPIGVVPEILAVVRGSSRFSYPWEDVRDAAAILRAPQL